MIQTPKHSPLPWQGNDAGLIYGQVSGDDDAAPVVCDVCDSPLEYTEQEKANAELIIHAVNSHQNLLETLKRAALLAECLWQLQGNDDARKIAERARAVIAAAETTPGDVTA